MIRSTRDRPLTARRISGRPYHTTLFFFVSRDVENSEFNTNCNTMSPNISKWQRITFLISQLSQSSPYLANSSMTSDAYIHQRIRPSFNNTTPLLWYCYLDLVEQSSGKFELKCTWVRWRRCGCLVTWFCYQLIAKPGNKTATPSWPDPYIVIQQNEYEIVACNISAVLPRSECVKNIVNIYRSCPSRSLTFCGSVWYIAKPVTMQVSVSRSFRSA